MDPVIPASLLRSAQPSAQTPSRAPASSTKPAPRGAVTPSWLLDPDDDRLGVGTMLAHTKQYRVEGCIGEGGMGWVYKAWDPVLERAVALKVMKPEVPESERDRFRREAVWGARFCHPSIARVFDLVGVPGQGISWFVMEFLPGRDLGTLIAKARARKLPIPLRLVADVFRQILGALEYSHECEVVHRDVKPENVFVTRDPNTNFVTSKLLDFGVALDRSAATPERHLVGDPRYIAPEQTRRSDVDGRADIYAAGMTLYEALTNRHPFADLVERGAPLPVMLEAQRSRIPAPPSNFMSDELPAALVCGLDVVVGKATAKDPDARFESARAMQEALLDALRSG